MSSPNKDTKKKTSKAWRSRLRCVRFDISLFIRLTALAPMRLLVKWKRAQFNLTNKRIGYSFLLHTFISFLGISPTASKKEREIVQHVKVFLLEPFLLLQVYIYSTLTSLAYYYIQVIKSVHIGTWYLYKNIFLIDFAKE